MPQLRWNDIDFLDFFAVEPTVEDFGVSYNYELECDGLRLLFTLWQFESVIQASLFRGTTEPALFTFAAYVRGEARFINDQRGRYMDFEDCIVAPSRFWYIYAGDPFDQQRFPISVTIRLVIDPDIRIGFVN
ncbi:MAG: hypothetical protein JNL18_04005 [Planctomycetaceae bacterium]|nr:hypothetical protein [Planctomyces sp.]MBL9161888.1 hypothetical protein [Planctomycetaceae bacterium]